MRYETVLPILMAFGLAGLAPGAADAQVRIVGQVVDNETLQPIPGAEVRIHDQRVPWRVVDRTFTNTEGQFTFEVKEHPGYIFRAMSIGYETAETPVLWIDDYTNYQVEIRLDPDAVLLAPIEVVARSGPRRRSAVVESFYERLDHGMGHYFTRLDMERLKPKRVSDVVARVPGVRLASSGAGLQRVIYFRRGTRQCPASIFIDGMQWNRPLHGDSEMAIDDAVAPGSVLGIEVYPGTATIPAEFLTPQSQCGVVAIWTRRQ